ncbi:MAG: NAD(P)H-hydrate dehydratase [Lachnospiraceae bacterium]|nr:NAD(P)H-hydrate dehydratase [Lachnospiraceae bacterium]
MKYEVLKIEDIAKIIPDRIKDSHKGTYGRVALLGGAVEYSGAIRLSAMALAALKSGAGLSTVAVPKYLVPIVSQNILEVMIYPIDSTENEIVFNKENIDDLIDKVDVLTCGMGLGKSKAAHEIIYYIVKNFCGKLVLDADALNILSENIDLLNEAKCKIILTPHTMEFKRLYDSAICIGEQQCRGEHCEPDIKYYEDNKIELAKEFVEKFNVTLLLKGPTTIVASSNVGASVNVRASFTSPLIKLIDRGTPGMSTAGSGDVLSGIITGLLGYIENEFDATCAAAFVNGMAGEFAARDEGEISMTASDTVKHISEAIKMIKNEK